MMSNAAYSTPLSVELLNEFDAEDVIVVDRKDEASEFKCLNTEELKDWLDSDYSLGELWNKNILGGKNTPAGIAAKGVFLYL